jgi:hypothetical protein
MRSTMKRTGGGLRAWQDGEWFCAKVGVWPSAIRLRRRRRIFPCPVDVFGSRRQLTRANVQAEKRSWEQG